MCESIYVRTITLSHNVHRPTISCARYSFYTHHHHYRHHTQIKASATPLRPVIYIYKHPFFCNRLTNTDQETNKHTLPTSIKGCKGDLRESRKGRENLSYKLRGTLKSIGISMYKHEY